MYDLENTPSFLRRLRLAVSRSKKLMRSWQGIAALILPTEQPEGFRAGCVALIDIGYILGLAGIARR